VEWEADSLPKASLEIQNRPRLEFEGEQQRSDSELSSKPNLTIPIEENPQLDSETSPPANESKDLVSEPCTQEMSLDSEINPPAYESKDLAGCTQESQNIKGSGQTVRKSSRLQDIPQKHWDFKQYGKDCVYFAKTEKRFLWLNAETLPTGVSIALC
jgi:hypothetical protein